VSDKASLEYQRLETRAALLRVKRRKANEDGLKVIQAQGAPYEPWQRGLIGMACYWRDHQAPRDELARRQRSDARRERERLGAARRRGASVQVIAGKSGRPRTGKDGLLAAAANEFRKGPTAKVIATFIVSFLAPRYLPKNLQTELYGQTAGKAERIARLESRIQRIAFRMNREQ
jgi:hypothetical protein